MTVRRLRPGDESILAYLAEHDPDFDVPGRGEPLTPLSEDAATAFLANPSVLHWVAFDGEAPVGHLYCLLVPLRSGDGQELLLYEIGVHHSRQRQGIGRLLMMHMERWMTENHVPEVWVLADNPVAVEFYRACGLSSDPDQPVYMTRRLEFPP